MTWEDMSRAFQRAAVRGRDTKITTLAARKSANSTATTMSTSAILNPYSRKKQPSVVVADAVIEVIDTDDDDAIEVVDNTDDEDDEVEIVQVRQVTPKLSSRMIDDEEDDDDEVVVVMNVRPTMSPSRHVAANTSSPLPPPKTTLSKPRNASISRPKEATLPKQHPSASAPPTLDTTRAKPARALDTLKVAISKPKSSLLAPKKISVPPKPKTAIFTASKVAKYQPLLSTLPDARSKLQNLLDARNEALAKQKSALVALKENMPKYKNGLIAHSVQHLNYKSPLTVLKEAQLKQKSALVARKGTLLKPNRPLIALTNSLPKRINALDALQEARSKRTSAGIVAVKEALKRKIVLLSTEDARPTSKRIVVPSNETMSKQASSVSAPKLIAPSERRPSGHVDQLDRFFFALLQYGRFEQDWAELCRRAQVPMPSQWSWGGAEPTTEQEHFGEQAALVLEEARHNLAQALLPLPSSATSRGPIHKLSVRVFHVATVVRPTIRSVGTKADQENTPPTHNVTVHCNHSGSGMRFSRGLIRPGTVVACVPSTSSGRSAKNDSTPQDALLLGAIVTVQGNPRDQSAAVVFSCQFFGLEKDKACLFQQGGVLALTILVDLTTELRCFEAVTLPRPRETIGFLDSLLGKDVVATSTATTHTEPANVYVSPYFQLPQLNAMQETAAQTFLQSGPNTITLVQGPPGTGRS
jgi:hypothetical protein